MKVNIWDFYGAKMVKVTTKNGKEIIGEITAIFDVEETYDSEDSITITTQDSIHVGIFASEVEKIEKSSK